MFSFNENLFSFPLKTETLFSKRFLTSHRLGCVGYSYAKITPQIYTHITKQMKTTVADVMEKY